jgi:uncharacterized protein YbaR (Trm112 family)
MKQSFADKLVCPIDKSELKLQVFATNTDNEIIEGLFTCPNCKRYYPIIYGLPIMTPDEYRQFELEQPMLMRWIEQVEGGVPTNKFLIEG